MCKLLEECWKLSGQAYYLTKLNFYLLVVSIFVYEVIVFIFLVVFRYVDLKACITKLPEDGFGSKMTSWPERLHIPPDRLQSIEIDAYIARKELFKAESKYWSDIISGYVRAYHWKKLRLRNVMDMKAGYGG